MRTNSPSHRVTARGIQGVALLSALLGALLTAPLARAGVQQKSLDHAAPGPVGIAVGPDGVVHVSWQSRDGHQLHYTRIERGKKVDQVLDSAVGWCGFQSSIALDSAGLPHIAYYADRGTDQVLAYAHFDGVAWHTEDLGPGGGGPAIAIDANDEPHIVHAIERMVGVSTWVSPLEYVHRDDSGWQHERPAGIAADPRVPLSLVLDPEGHVHVAMQSFPDYLPVYATDASGDWVATTLGDNNTIVGSLVLDSLGHPHVALALASAGTIRHSHFDGSQWLTDDLFGPSDLPPGTSNMPQSAALVLDAHDRPAVLFKTQIYVERFAEWFDFLAYAYHDGVEWRGLLVSHRASDDWVRLGTDANGASYGAYGRRRGSDSAVVTQLRVPLPDLTGDWASLATSQRGAVSRVDAVLDVRNEGTGNSRSAPIALYLSSDAVLDPGDTPLAVHKGTGAVATGRTKSIRISFTRPGSVAGFYLIAVLDPKGRLDDLDRPNNTIVGLLGD